MKNYFLKPAFFSLLLLYITFIVSCFSPWKEDEGLLSINFGVSGASDSSRSFVNLESGEFRNFTNTVILKSTNGNRIERTFSGAAGSVSVPPGVYTVSIKASDSSGVRAFGIHNNTVTIRAGQNVSAGLTMYSAVEVTNETEFRAAFELANRGSPVGVTGGETGRHLYILIGRSFVCSGSHIDVNGRVTLVSETDAEINYNGNSTDAFFQVREDSDLSLGAEYMPGTIILSGNKNNTSLFNIAGGILRMYEGITIQDCGFLAISINVNGIFNLFGGRITGNNGVNPGGGGVNVGSGGTFNMYNGRISDNSTIGSGGGVFVGGGTFNMYGGIITENRATGGGGVTVAYSATFNMYGGTISFNIADGSGGGIHISGDDSILNLHDGSIFSNISGANTPGSGGGINMYGGTVIMSGGIISRNNTNNGGGVNLSGGTFEMQGGEISGNSAVNNGGGVWVGGTTGIFNMNGGIIYGMDASISLRNTAGQNSAALFVDTHGTANVFDSSFSDSTDTTLSR
ncbi:MAG: hypothetical protein FWD14_05645 [Treponema sp.]|nr:hypothetical protein [Treponema sp.]